MGAFLALLSSLKSEISWIISSLALAPAAAEEQSSTDAQTAGDKASPDPKDAHAHDGEAKVTSIVDTHDSDAKVASIVKTHDDSAPHHHAPLSLSTEQNYLHHIAYHSGDGDAANARGGLLAPASSDSVSAPHNTVASVDPSLVEKFSSVSPSFDDTGSHTSPSASDNTVTNFAGGHGAAHGGGGSGPYLTWDTSKDVSSPLDITINFDSSVANAPKGGLNGVNGFVYDVEKVADFFASTFSDPTHITINVGYGEVEGFHIGGALGESITNIAAVSYSSLESKLISDPGANVTSFVPGSDPVSGRHTWVLSTANEKALGIIGTNNSVDGWVGFGSAANTFDYTAGETPPSGQYSFMSVVAHEISEVMGRMLFVGGSHEYNGLDLFHFADSDGSHIYSGTTAGYFSIGDTASDGSLIKHEYNTSPSGDFADWASGPTAPADWTADSFDAFGGAGSLAPVSEVDLEVMDAIGWNRVGSTDTWAF